MKSVAAAFVLAALIPQAFGLTVNSPVNIVECQPLQLTWQDGTPPYFLSLIPPQQPSAPALEQFPTQTGTSLTWNVNLQANTNFNIALKDSSGALAFSSLLTVLPGTDTSCLTAAVSVSGSGAANASTGASGASSTGAAAASGGSATTTTQGSSGTSTPKASGAASHSAFVGSLGIAGLVGIIGAALF